MGGGSRLGKRKRSQTPLGRGLGSKQARLKNSCRKGLCLATQKKGLTSDEIHKKKKKKRNRNWEKEGKLKKSEPIKKTSFVESSYYSMSNDASLVQTLAKNFCGGEKIDKGEKGKNLNLRIGQGTRQGNCMNPIGRKGLPG